MRLVIYFDWPPTEGQCYTSDQHFTDHPDPGWNEGACRLIEGLRIVHPSGYLLLPLLHCPFELDVLLSLAEFCLLNSSSISLALPIAFFSVPEGSQVILLVRLAEIALLSGLRFLVSNSADSAREGWALVVRHIVSSARSPILSIVVPALEYHWGTKLLFR